MNGIREKQVLLGKAMIKYRNEEDAYPELYWSGTSNKKYVEGFIDFCRQGAFNIY